MSSPELAQPLTARMFLLGESRDKDTAGDDLSITEQTRYHQTRDRAFPPFVRLGPTDGRRPDRNGCRRIPQVSSTHHPCVELLVDETKVYTFVFELTVEFDLTGVVAVVRRGELVPPQRKTIDLAIFVPLRPAIPLIREAETF